MISTLISADSATISNYMYYLITGWPALIVLFPAIGIIAIYHSWYFLYAPFWITCLVVTNHFFSKLSQRMVVKKLKYSDQIGQRATEIVKGMKNIKFNVWENVSVKSIMSYRKGELKINSFYLILIFIAINFGNLVPTCITASIYVSSLRDGISLNVSEVYFLLALTSTLVSPSVNLVKWYNFKIRSDVSFSRISKFLGLEAKIVSNRSNDVEKG
jgi:ABC-type multidrug transport system fused ATPase/permease subunit